MPDELYRIIYETQGEADAQRLANEVKKAEEALAKHLQTLGRIPAAQAAMDATARGLAQTVAGLRTQLAAADAQAGSMGRGLAAAGAGMGTLGRSAGGARTNLAGIAGTLDDMQYVGEQGLRPIINNITALAPAAGIALIAIYQLMKSFGGLDTLLQGSKLKTMASEMEELAKKTEKTANETERLARYEKQLRQIKGLKEGQSPEERDRDRMFAEAIGGDMGKLGGALTADRQRRGQLPADDQALESEARARVAAKLGIIDFAGDVWNKMTGDQRNAIEDKVQKEKEQIRKEQGESIDADINAARDDPAKLRRLMEVAPPEIAARLREFQEDPTGAKRKAAKEAQEKADRETKQAQDKAAREREQAQDKAARNLQERFNLRSAQGAAPGEADTAAELLRGGVAANPQEAMDLASGVHARLQANYGEALAKRAGEKGLSAEGAAADLAAEATAKQQEKAQEQQEKAAREAEQAQRDRVKQAEDLMSGSSAERRAERGLFAGWMASGDPEAARRNVTGQYAAELQQRGMGQQDAELAAQELVGKIFGKFGDQVNETMMGPGSTQAKSPQVVAATEWAKAVQTGMDPAKQQVDLQTQMRDHLRTIADKLGLQGLVE
jgi:hypothetical protein